MPASAHPLSNVRRYLVGSKPRAATGTPTLVARTHLEHPGAAGLARTLQISETVLDPVIDLVRHSGSANCGRGSTPAATAKDTERAGIRAGRHGYPYRNTERDGGAEQHFRDHQMPRRWSRCMLCAQGPLAADGVPVPAHWVWSGDGVGGVRHVLIVAFWRGRVAHASATPGYLLPANPRPVVPTPLPTDDTPRLPLLVCYRSVQIHYLQPAYTHTSEATWPPP